MINNLEHVVRKKFLNPEEVSSLVSIFSYAFDDIDAHKPSPDSAPMGANRLRKLSAIHLAAPVSFI